MIAGKDIRLNVSICFNNMELKKEKKIPENYTKKSCFVQCQHPLLFNINIVPLENSHIGKNRTQYKCDSIGET